MARSTSLGMSTRLSRRSDLWATVSLRPTRSPGWMRFFVVILVPRRCIPRRIVDWRAPAPSIPTRLDGHDSQPQQLGQAAGAGLLEGRLPEVHLPFPEDVLG